MANLPAPEIIAQRVAILRLHEKRLARHRAEIEAAQAYLDHKIAVYSGRTGA
ncbi:MAG: hypothetical protein MUE98_16820 [Rhodobacteraceae bacterium]|nr:hypothetical protein [Paracoccaceae bacterium]